MISPAASPRSQSLFCCCLPAGAGLWVGDQRITLVFFRIKFIFQEPKARIYAASSKQQGSTTQHSWHSTYVLRLVPLTSDLAPG